MTKENLTWTQLLVSIAFGVFYGWLSTWVNLDVIIAVICGFLFVLNFRVLNLMERPTPPVGE